MRNADDHLAYDRQHLLAIPPNQFHPLVYVAGNPEVGADVYVGLFSEINAVGARIVIGNGCDIASFVSINVADSHLKCVGLANDVHRADIVLGDKVFVGSHSVILGGCQIGSNSVVAAGSIVRGVTAPPWSLIFGNPAVCLPGKYSERARDQGVLPDAMAFRHLGPSE